MKSYLLVLVAALATSVLGTPNPALAELPAALQTRETCKHPGPCGWFQSGQCEYNCDGYGGFKYMQGCGWGRKRCCCNVATS